MTFQCGASKAGARVGQLVLGGTEIPTPNYMAVTIRGMIPHLTPDLAPKVPLAAVYAEHFWDSHGPVTGALQALPRPAQAVVCGVWDPQEKSTPDVRKRAANTDTSLTIDCRQGRLLVSVQELSSVMAAYDPHLMILPYDNPMSNQAPGRSRLSKMQRRTREWTQLFTEKRQASHGQWQFLESLNLPEHADEMLGVYGPKVSPDGLNVDSVLPPDLLAMLDQVANGADIVYAPFTAYTDRGLAITLDFTGLSTDCVHEDLNQEQYITDMTMLGETGYAKAYVHHLLECREMTAYVILQLYNLSKVEKLFADIRASLAAGTFSEDLERVKKHYKSTSELSALDPPTKSSGSKLDKVDKLAT